MTTGGSPAESRAARLRALLLEAATLPVDGRAAFLDRACGDDAALRTAVEAELAGDGETLAFTRMPGPDARDAVGAELPAGTRLGPWCIDTLVGRGGMGEVYAAQRADGVFDLRVAIKLLKRGLDTDAIVTRFGRERRILAQLDHPNIAHVLDAGVASDGRPFLAMEFVDGRPITEHVRSQSLSVKEALQLMITACDAVQAAHARQIVHRDLKPSNVLVTAQGQVKLLDFGIAKALAEEDADATRIAGEAMAYTPAYAAPEQLLGQPVTPACDVYALGCILYQLLVERLPHERIGRTTHEIIRTIGQETTTPPSAALRSERGRLAEPTRLARLRTVSRDLDLIVLEALHPEANRRYADASALAEDLRRLLDDRPVLARPDSLAYRTTRFVRRNRVIVTAVSGIAVALVLGLVSSLWQAHRATRAALTAGHVKQFMLDFVREQDRYRRDKSTARTPEELIQQAIGRANTELIDEPTARIEVLRALGYIAVDTGRIDLVRQTLVPLLNYTRQQFGDRSVETGHVLTDLADAEYFSDRAKALLYAKEAIPILRAHQETQTAKFADIEARLGLLEEQDQGQLIEGEALLRDALKIFSAVLGPDHPDTAWARFQLASVHFELGRDDDAEKELRLAISQLQRVQGGDTIRLQRPFALLSQLLVRSGRLNEALDTADQAIAIVRAQARHQDMRLGDAIRARVEVLTAMHRLREAELLSGEALTAIPPEAETFIGVARRTIARLDLANGHPQAAEELLAQNLELRRREDGHSGVDLTALLEASLHGTALAMMGRMDEGEKQQREALQVAIKALGQSAASLIELHSQLAGTLEMRDDWPEAIDHRRQALSIAANVYGAKHEQWARCAHALAHVLLSADDKSNVAEASDLLQRTLATYAALPAPQPDLAVADLDLARAMLDAGNHDAARPLLTKALALLRDDEGARKTELQLARSLASTAASHGSRTGIAVVVNGQRAATAGRTRAH